ncbi:Rho guanine nucleotide exchange factor [Marasmius sp. AFHP31]|nr:Rho guanine nucleotide exchange factor [Marasmius sp. AFHP31]
MASDPEFTRLAEYLQTVIQDQSELRRLMELTGDDAQAWLDKMQQLVDRPATSPQLRSSVFTVMLRLSKNSGLHPHCLSIQNVTKLGEYPVASGGFGDVWKGAIGESQHVCLKIVKLYLGSDVEKLSKEYLREAIVWRQMKHPNLLPFLGIYRIEQTQQLCLISPWMDKGNLIQFVKTTPREDVDHFALVYDIASGLRHLHDLRVVHGDLKGVNVLITPDGRACIGDFGLSRVAVSMRLTTSTSAGPMGTARWLAPELLTVGEATTKESDIYAYGCVCYEVFTGLQPFSEISQDAAVVLQVILGSRPKRPTNAPELTDAMWAIMKSCWNAEPNARPSAEKIVAQLRTDTKVPATAASDWAESLSKHILNNVEQTEPQDAVGPPLPDDDDSTSVYDGSSTKGIYSGIQSPLPPVSLLNHSPLTSLHEDPRSSNNPTNGLHERPSTHSSTEDHVPHRSGSDSSAYEIHIESPGSSGSPFPSPVTARPLPASPALHILQHTNGKKPVRPTILTDGNTLSPKDDSGSEEPSPSSAHGVERNGSRRERRRHWEASYGTLTSGETSPLNFGLGRTCRTVNLESPKGPRPPNISRTASPGSARASPTTGSAKASDEGHGEDDARPDTSEKDKHSRNDSRHGKGDASKSVVNVAVVPDTEPSNVRGRVRQLHDTGKRHAGRMQNAIARFVTGDNPPYSPAGVTDEWFDELVSGGLRIREDIAFQQGRKEQGHTMIEKIWLVEADAALKNVLIEFEDLAKAAARRRASLKRKEASNRASDEETVEHLYQECQIGRENAGLLTRALIRANPASLHDPVVQDLHSRCTSSMELISQRLPWAILRAESAAGGKGLDSSDEEDLLNNLLFAQEVLKGALQQCEEQGVS